MKNKNVALGLISGIIVSAWMVTWWMSSSPEEPLKMSNSLMFAIGILTMLIGFTTVVIANRRTNRQTEGILKYWTLFKSGLIIVSVATIIYVGIWMILYKNGGSELMELMQQAEIERIEASDLTESEKAKKIEKSRDMMVLYDENFLVRAGVTITEIFPLGLLIAAISALIFRRKG